MKRRRLCFVAMFGVICQFSAAASATEYNSAMKRKEAVSLVKTAERALNRECVSKDAYEYPCQSFVAEAVIGNMHLSNYIEVDDLLNFNVSKDICYKYSYSTGSYSKGNWKIWSLERNSVQVFIKDKIGGPQSRDSLIYSYLCSFAIAGGQISGVEPNAVKEYFQDSDDRLEMVRKHLGDAEADMAAQFIADIIVPYVAFQYKIYQENIDKSSDFAQLNLELTLNAEREVRRRGFSAEYIRWMEKMVSDAKNSI